MNVPSAFKPSDENFDTTVNHYFPVAPIVEPSEFFNQMGLGENKLVTEPNSKLKNLRNELMNNQLYLGNQEINKPKKKSKIRGIFESRSKSKS